ncbi:MAG: hypothetical protein KGJ62_03315 [Armatimonadetes bacterium]|nr:hypothetical protein [Armatimonadota bacterium]MDE2205737.1 hypothetical protein [Armatimonadota bacterium]
MRKEIAVAMLALMAIAGAGCSGGKPTGSAGASTSSVVSQINTAIAADPAANGTAPQLALQNGSVVLTGEAPSISAKTAIENDVIKTQLKTTGTVDFQDNITVKDEGQSAQK